MENIEKTNKKKGWALLISGSLFLLASLFCGGFCLIELISAMVENNSLGLALMILILITYGLVGVASGVISLILNGLSYKKAESLKRTKLMILIASIVALALNLLAFILWIISSYI